MTPTEKLKMFLRCRNRISSWSWGDAVVFVL